MELYGCLPEMSPYVSHTDAYLSMVGIPLESVILEKGDFTATPKGKLPWIIDSDGTSISDTQLIHYYLEGKYNDPLDGWLSREQRPP